MMVARQLNSLAKIIEVDAEKCVNCHACIAACPVKYCNDGSGDVVKINHNMCIGCGNCMRKCNHNARYYLDDFVRFMQDLVNGEQIVAVVAPSAVATFPETYLNLNGWLTELGVKAVFDVSFGAELTVKSYVDYIERTNPKTVIAQPCPAIVTFVQLYMPELLPYLAPVDSPMLHTMKMVQEYFPAYAGCKFVAISPCMAKKREFEETMPGTYNVGFKSIHTYLEQNSIALSQFPQVQYTNPPAERAVLFSSPGGLQRTLMRWHKDIDAVTRRIEGVSSIYEYLEKLPQSIQQGNAPLLVDCLNCELGCNGGPLTMAEGKSVDNVEAVVNRRSEEQKRSYQGSDNDGDVELQQAVTQVLDKYWKMHLFNRSYRNLSTNNRVVAPDENALQDVFYSMHKYSDADIFDCNSCGYGTCHNMAVAIFNGLNKPENCHFFLAEEARRAHSEISENEKRLRTILSTTTVGFCLADAAYKILLVNPALCSMMGVTKERLIGNAVFKSQFALCANAKPVSTEIKINKPDGTHSIHMFNANPYMDENNKIIGYFAMITSVATKGVFEQNRK